MATSSALKHLLREAFGRPPDIKIINYVHASLYDPRHACPLFWALRAFRHPHFLRADFVTIVLANIAVTTEQVTTEQVTTEQLTTERVITEQVTTEQLSGSSLSLSLSLAKSSLHRGK